jgi:hypothetical protein
MQKLFFSLFLVFWAITSFGQITQDDIDKATNGIQDGKEKGIDCGDVYGLLQSCNGNVSIDFNTKKYSTGVIYVINNGKKEATVENENSFTLTFKFFKGSPTKYMSLTLGPFIYYSMNPMKTKLKTKSIKQDALFNIKYISPSVNLLYVNGGAISEVEFDRLDKTTFFEITQVDKVERLMSGKFYIKGVTNDGTPVDMTGTFDNVSY